jgi:D-amino-acid dehydrogenase
MRKNEPHLRDLCQLSQGLFEELSQHSALEFQYDKKGLLMLCQTPKALEHELHVLKRANSLNVEAKEMSPSDIKQLETHVKIDAIGGVYFPNDSHTTPSDFMVQMKHYLEKIGVNFLLNKEVTHFNFKHDNIESLCTSSRNIMADDFVVASGIWSAKLLKQLKLKLLLQPGKGYAFESKRISNISIPSILVEAKTAVTPMHEFTRFAGTMEISGFNNKLNDNRIQSIAAAVEQFYPDITITQEEKATAKYGYRPLSPDGMPYIGKPNNFKNLTIATGHAMIGWTLGPGTGKIVSELILNQKPSVDLSPYHPNRKF